MVNPFEAEASVAFELLDHYFDNIGSTTYCFLPERQFKRWLADRSIKKMPDDLMLMYAMLAMATIFTTKKELRDRGREFAAICRCGNDGRDFSLQVVQSRLLLSLFSFANNHMSDAWDFCGGALSSAKTLNLNLEPEQRELETKTIFGMKGFGYAECRRRTFWSCYLMDHFTGFTNGHLSTINPKDVFLRLPCHTRYFEDQAEVSAPFFDSSRLPSSVTLENAGAMAYLVNITTIWGDVRANIYRGSQSSVSASSQTEPFTTFYTKTNMRLEAWSASLPPDLRFTTENLDATIRDGLVGSFVSMHAINVTTSIKLNRYVQPSSVPPQQLRTFIKQGYIHSFELLHQCDVIANRLRNIQGVRDGDRRFTTPYMGFALLVASDIVSAKGHLQDVPEMLTRLEGARILAGDLAMFWHAGTRQRDKLNLRIEVLGKLPRSLGSPGSVGAGWSVLNRGEEGEKFESAEAVVWRGKECWECKYAMDKGPKQAGDCVYGVDWETWVEAVEGRK
jgi:hypothetical protein